MINDEFTQYCYLNILDIYYDDSIDERLKLIRSFNFLKDFLKKLDEDNTQLFSSFFQRLHYIATKFQFKKNLAKKIFSLRAYVGKLSSDKSIAITEYELSLRLCDLFFIIKDLSNTEFPANVPFINDDIINEDRKKFYQRNTPQKTAFVPFLRVIVNSIESIDSQAQVMLLSVRNSIFDTLQLKIQGIWFAHQNMYAEGTVMNLLNCGFDGKYYFTQDNTLLSIEPDYLIDVTDIADCFSGKQANPNLYFLSKFQKSSVSLPALTGNIVNHIFDELIYNNDADFEAVFDRALKMNPLQIIALLENKTDLHDLKLNVYRNYSILKDVVPRFRGDCKTIEPTYISAKFGIQGRLDLLIENKNEQKDVIELKSGKAPSKDLYYSDIDNRHYGLSIWKNHCIQAVCYIMLLDSAYKSPSITSSILYSSSEHNSLRNVPNIIQLKREILKCRNYIVAVERALSNDNFSIFSKFNSASFGEYPQYKLQSINEFSINYNGFSELEKEYFHSFVGFLSRENFCRKLGNSGYNNGFSSLWLDTFEEKEESYSILRHLKLDFEGSDFDKMHLKFKITYLSGVSNIRRGDICIVYSIPNNSSVDVLSGQILKGSIREMYDDTIVISFRNKLNRIDFDERSEWVVEPDSIEMLSKLLFTSIYSMLRCGKDKREMLLGIAEPKTKSIEKIFYPELNDNQLEVLYKALSAKDYFLLQGPPGTGKTSFLLRYMVKYLFENTDENVLLLAYTNRAADEICNALLRIKNDFPFLRLGGKESSDYQENLVSILAENMNISDIREKINTTRVFVSTIASALTTAEIFDIKNFQTVIIDEASQVSEANLFSILTKTSRFILIGDEKQLPAIVLQHNSTQIPQSETLKEIELTNLGDSYFERMLRLAKKHNRTDAYGMLTHQARMNVSIMNLANELFYNNYLKNIKLRTNSSFLKNSTSKDASNIIKIMSENDIVFINTKSDSRSKVNKFEADLACYITKELYEHIDKEFTGETIGIITPFRAQVSQIYNSFDSILQRLVTIDTVERYQGSERDIIIISFAVNHQFDLSRIINISNNEDELIDRKLNVAITRAKERLVLLGNASLLSESPVHKKLLNIIKQKYLFIEPEEID